MKPAALSLENVHYAYNLGTQKVPALNGISLEIREGEMVAIQGPRDPANPLCSIY